MWHFNPLRLRQPNRAPLLSRHLQWRLWFRGQSIAACPVPAYDFKYSSHSRGFRVVHGAARRFPLRANPPAAPASPYGGATVEEIIARVNDQIITSSDYERAMQELDQEERQHGASMQQISEAHKDLLRNLIDQQLGCPRAKNWGSPARPNW